MTVDTTYHAQRIRATEAAYNRAVATLSAVDKERYTQLLAYRRMAQNDAQLAQRVEARCMAIMADADDALADVLWSEKRYTAALAAAPRKLVGKMDKLVLDRRTIIR